MNKSYKVTGQIVDVINRRIFEGILHISNGIIARIEEIQSAGEKPSGSGDFAVNQSGFILPGFIDAHIHIESSMLTPYEFARKALTHGTVATVSDPHEIANVCGLKGVTYMLENARDAKLKFHFGAPSCVPATDFETSGDELSAVDVKTLLSRNDIFYLSEMMNYPGVLNGNEAVMEKIRIAKYYNKPVDGHAPGLMGSDAIKYIEAGISTDHECFTKSEALHKIHNGMKILIREGSAARNFSALHELISEFPDMVMFCSDDKHPDELMLGHIDSIVKRAIAMGHDLFDVLKCACINPVLHYKMKVGILRENDEADFIVVNNLSEFQIQATYINGELISTNGLCMLPQKSQSTINNFSAHFKTASEFVLPASGKNIRVIEAVDGQLITNEIRAKAKILNSNVVADIENDILKLVVVNRYEEAPPVIAFIKNFNLVKGAIASTVAHDSHNIICVGTDDESIAKAINLLIECKGGLSVYVENESLVLPLPVAGLMSTLSCEEVSEKYSNLDKKVKDFGCRLQAPFMTLSFMALLVIPDLKLSDQGLFSGSSFGFTDNFVD